MPAKAPLWQTMVAALGLDRIGAPGWAWGVAGTLFALLWVVAIYNFFKQQHVELFDEHKA